MVSETDSYPYAGAIASVIKTCYNSEVYEPSDDTFALVDAIESDAEALQRVQPLSVLEVGCGSGFVLCSAALLLQRIGVRACLLGTDVSDAALQATRGTLIAHDVRHVELLRADMMTALTPRLGRQLDVIIFNPPYVVTPDEEVERGGIAAAWAGGRDGRVVIDVFLAQLEAMLAPGGRAYLVTIAQNKPQQICEWARTRLGLHAEVLLRRRADEELLSILLLKRT